jgi:hypothetical protein
MTLNIRVIDVNQHERIIRHTLTYAFQGLQKLAQISVKRS